MRTLLLMLLWVLAAPVISAEESDAPEPVFPQKLTASQLLVSCAASSMSATGRLRQKYCEGFLSGLEEGVRVHSLISKQEVAPSLCVPPDVSARQLRSAFVRNSANMTLSREKPAAMFAMKVLQHSFPCR